MNLGEPTVSIVVCSVGRPDALELCIDGLSRLVDVAFEIVVVLGPGAESSTHRLRERPGIATIVGMAASPIRASTWYLPRPVSATRMVSASVMTDPS